MIILEEGEELRAFRILHDGIPLKLGTTKGWFAQEAQKAQDRANSHQLANTKAIIEAMAAAFKKEG